jgi:hypothetical protein
VSIPEGVEATFRGEKLKAGKNEFLLRFEEDEK